MNKLTATLVLSVICLTAGAQSKSLESFYNEYRGKKDVTHVSLSGSVFKLASWISEFSDEDDEDLKALGDISEGIKGMEIMNIDDYEDYFDDKEIEALIKNMKGEGFEVIMTVREERKFVRILAENVKGNILSNISIITRDGRDFSAITITGVLHMDDLEQVMDN